MADRVFDELPAACRWTSRLAVFSIVLVLTAAVLHRLGLPTPAAFNLVLMAYAGAAVALVLAIVGMVSIWRHGGSGASRVVVGMFISLLMFGAAAIVAVLAKEYPAINDVSTDTVSPPPFKELAKLRGTTGNPAAYPKEFAPVQAQYYADLQPLLIDRPINDVYEVAVEVLKRQHYTIVSEDPGGVIEAVDKSMVLGFSDDISVRVSGTPEQARIDIRSASRFGKNDFGHNAARVRLLLKEVVGRLEETVPSADGERAGAAKKTAKPGVKPEKERAGSTKEIPRKQRDRDR